MEKISPKMAAAFGVGFIGFIFAAYSYNQQHKDEFIHYSNEHLNTSETKIAENSDNDSLDKTKNEQNITEKVTSFLEDIKKKQSNWGKFWKGEYEDMRNKDD